MIFARTLHHDILGGINSEGEKCHKFKYFREILPNLTPGYLFMLGRSAASKIIYVRPVGSPENTSNIGENPNINHWRDPLDPHPNRPTVFFFCPKFIYGTFSALINCCTVMIAALATVTVFHAVLYGNKLLQYVTPLLYRIFFRMQYVIISSPMLSVEV